MSSSNLSPNQDSGGTRALAVRGAGALPPLFEVRTSRQTQTREQLQSIVKTLPNDCAPEAASDTKDSRGRESVGVAPGAAPNFAPTAVDASMTVVDASMTVAGVALATLRRSCSAWLLLKWG